MINKISAKLVFSLIFLVIIHPVNAQNQLRDQELSAKIDDMQALVRENSYAINVLQDLMRELSNQKDIVLRLKSDEQKIIEELEKRLLLLETIVRKLNDQAVADPPRDQPRDQSTVSERSSNALQKAPALDLEQDAATYRLAEQDFLRFFDPADEKLSEQNLFQFSQNLRYTGKYSKTRAYLEKYRQKYPQGVYYQTSIYLTGLTAATMKDYPSCIFFLKEHISKGSKESVYSAEWQLVNCYKSAGLHQEYERLLRKIASDRSHPQRKVAIEELSK